MSSAAKPSAQIHYAVCGFDHISGPVKSIARLAQIQAHNCRLDDLPHVVASAPAPLHLIGTGDLIADVRATLAAHGIADVRKGGNYAWEAVLTASHSFFFDDAGVLDAEKVADWAMAAQGFACQYWGERRVAAMVLHLDEYTPHIHTVLVPLAYREGGRFGARWSLDTAVLSAPGEWQRMHTNYAKAMAPLGLSRGKLRSGQKFKPFAEVLAEIEMTKERLAEAEERAVNERAAAREAQDRAAALLAQLEEEKCAFAEEKAALGAEAKEVALLREQVDRDLAEAALHLTIAEAQSLAADRAWEALDRRQSQLDDAMDVLAADEGRMAMEMADFEAEQAKAVATRSFFEWAERTALEFVEALDDLPEAPLSAPVRNVLKRIDYFRVALGSDPLVEDAPGITGRPVARDGRE